MSSVLVVAPCVPIDIEKVKYLAIGFGLWQDWNFAENFGPDDMSLGTDQTPPTSRGNEVFSSSSEQLKRFSWFTIRMKRNTLML